MGAERVAVVGCGQTRHQATRGDVSIAGLVREAAMRALEDAGMTWSDIDAVVVGKAPDFFEGLMMPELYLAEALGAVGKPMLRVHTAGSVAGSTAIVASSAMATLPTPPPAPVTKMSPLSGVTPCFCSAITHSMAV